MDDIRDLLAKIRDAIAAWIEFGMLWLAVIIFLPYALIIGSFLLALPVILFLVGINSPWVAAIYIFVIMGFVGAYCYRKYVNGGDSDSPIAGRSILPEKRAIRKSRSIMRNSRSRRR